MRDDGATEGDHCDVRDRIKSKMPGVKGNIVASGPACPPELIHVWNWFAEILTGVAPNGMGPAQVAWTDVLAWSQLTGERPSAFEVRVILGLSVTRVESLQSER